jgi:hypothetical protein
MKHIKRPVHIPAKLIDIAICRFLWHGGICEDVGCSNCEYTVVGCKEIDELRDFYFENILEVSDEKSN